MAAPLPPLDDDARILDRIRKGDEDALEILYHANRPVIAAYVARNGGTGDDAEDMVQEAVVILWERVRSGSFEHKAKLGTFLYATVRNLWLRRLSRQRREIRTDLRSEQIRSEDESILEVLIESDQAAIVARALDNLGDPCKTLLVLYYWEELTTDEIAVRLGYA
ncbi:MAG: sigma-70 family RNA polymerase sigma factor, partial [Bacteroidota bacterium]